MIRKMYQNFQNFIKIALISDTQNSEISRIKMRIRINTKPLFIRINTKPDGKNKIEERIKMRFLLVSHQSICVPEKHSSA